MTLTFINTSCNYCVLCGGDTIHTSFISKFESKILFKKITEIKNYERVACPHVLLFI